MKDSICSIEECANPKVSRGWCNAHYKKWIRHGDPLGGRTYQNGLQGFYARIQKTSSCWIWTGPLKDHGYATLSFEGKIWYAHRLSYFLNAGEIPDGMDIDHACHVRSCVNPAHLQAVTRKQNLENQSGAHRGNSSGVRGVSWRKSRSTWRAQVTHNGTTLYFGEYKTIKEAESAVIEARNKLFTNNLLDRVA